MRGFSVIEIVISIAVITLAISSAVLVSGGAQLSLEGGEENAEALSMAQALLEEQQSLARQDIDLVHNVATSTKGIYQKSVSVSQWPSAPYDALLIVASVSWTSRGGIKHSVSLPAVVGRMGRLQSESCVFANGENWRNSHVVNYQLSTTTLAFMSSFGHTISVSNPIASMVASRGFLFVGVASTSAKKDDTIFVFDITDLARAPRYIASIDNNVASTKGVNAIKATGAYVYAVSAHDTTLHIFDVSNPSNIVLIKDYTIPTSAAASSLFYKDGYVYLGSSKSNTGLEFNMLDVHDPHAPIWVGGYEVGAIVQAIYAAHGYAYLATDSTTRDLIVLDVHDPANPTSVAVYNASNPHSASMYVRGDTLFLGLTPSFGAPEVRIFDISQPTSIMPIASQGIGASAVGILVRDTLMFVLTSTTKLLKIFDISNSSNIVEVTPSTTLPGVGVALTCSGSTIILGSNLNGQGYISFVSTI
jgi:type II secretory pathway pseudopilin PulG